MVKESVNAYILHTRPFKETSLLIDLFSQERGRFSVLAKGIKRKNAQAQRAILQPFNWLNIEYLGRTDLKTMCQCELVNDSISLPHRALACGYYMNELLSRAIHEEQEFYQLFQLYQQSIKALNTSENFAIILRNFEVCLLEELGVAPQWNTDTNGVDLCSQSAYYFVFEQGFEQVTDTLDISSPSVSNKCFSGEAILSLANRRYNSVVMKECQQITQLLLRHIIGNKPLESRKLWL